jgi:YihY family inner membrane protein
MFMSAFPMILSLLSILGLFIHDQSTQATVAANVTSYFAPGTAATVSHALQTVRTHTGVLGLVGILGLLWSGSSLFSSLEWPFGAIYGTKQRPFLKQRAVALAMTGLFFVTVIGVVAINLALEFLHAIPAVNTLVGFLVWTLFLLTLYLVIPTRTMTVRRVWRGAAIGGALMELITLIWPLYLARVHGFDAYGSAFALFFVIATWMYLTSQVLLLGLVINREANP